MNAVQPIRDLSVLHSTSVQQASCGLTLKYLNEQIAHDFHEVGEDKEETVLKTKLWMYNFH